ncbi:hypothetical protein Tco_1548228 [Tanacetum coccineum]
MHLVQLCPGSVPVDRVPYASAVGSLMYAMVCTRPDLAHAVGVVSRFLSNPGKKHWETVKWIFRYLREASEYVQARDIESVQRTNCGLKRFLQEHLVLRHNVYTVLCDNQSIFIDVMLPVMLTKVFGSKREKSKRSVARSPVRGWRISRIDRKYMSYPLSSSLASHHTTPPLHFTFFCYLVTPVAS